MAFRSSLVQRRAEFRALRVNIGTPLEQRTHNSIASMARSNAQRRETVGVPRLDADKPRVEQTIDNLRPTLASSIMKGRVADLVFGRRVGASSQQNLDNVGMATSGGNVERRTRVAIPDVNNGARIDKELHKSRVSVARCLVQRRLAECFLTPNVGANIEEDAGYGFVAVARGQVESGASLGILQVNFTLRTNGEDGTKNIGFADRGGVMQWCPLLGIYGEEHGGQRYEQLMDMFFSLFVVGLGRDDFGEAAVGCKC
ncbi:hypothetical protein EV126DRAFT_64743 [Verticillium dahliae]|nr:hypothetical protein EV126DRAFT_64743 [Verticillium dahliae]